ncbi:response regulator [Desulfopila inferna]|uniref:response regulator n=1 Tax=Desulfopila inferna TaxID=468528 RepID=UPI001F06B921|nr:response regulator [Desulfopila inferna]
MLRLADIRIRPKLLFLFIQTGIFPIVVAGYFFSSWMEKSLIEESFNKLTTIQDIRKGQIENHFAKSFADIRLLADSERIYTFLGRMSVYKDNLDTSSLDGFNISTREYADIIKNIQKPLQDYTFLNSYSDLYLVNADFGQVMFSVKNGEDNGVNLLYGSLNRSALAKVWKDVIESGTTVISDFAPYAPAENKEVAFISHPVKNSAGDNISVVALRFDSDLISKITESRKGMGETGESYLVGWQEDTESFEFRSNMTTMGEGKYVVGYDLGKKLDYWLDAAESGEEGGKGIYIDSAGQKVLVAFNKLKLEGLDWYLISKIDKYEVTAPVRDIYRKVGVFALLFTALTAIWAWFISRGFTLPLIRDMHFADAISHGDFSTQLKSNRKDELGDLARSLNKMAANLKEVDWLKSGKEQLDDTIRGELGPDELARRCITFFVKHFEADLGAIYILHEGCLELRASYAFTDRRGNFNSFVPGEGMVGQAALETEILYFSAMGEDAPQINYGAGEKPLNTYLAAPLHVDGEVSGVMLIGSMRPFNELQKQFLKQNISNMAILFNAATSRRRIAELLADAQAQQEELKATNEELENQATALRESEAEMQAQQEELRVTNEELEEQTRALKESEGELRAQEEELRVTNEELEERTRALEEQKNEIWAKNSDLHEAREIVERKVKELEVASKYKSEFLANMSHELRTPLNSILILSQLLGNNKDGNLTPRQIESSAAIHSSGTELLKLINEILDLSKIEAGKIDLVIEDVPLRRILDDINLMYKDIAENKGLDLSFELAEGLPSVIRTDSQRLQQVLRNLITNAFKFTKEGTVSLEISRPSAEMVKDTALIIKNSLAFVVKDQGIGIPEDKQRVIFEAFQQADGSTSRTYGGTGLGLSISRELVRLLGGAIHLYSVPGEGSTFTVVLPEKCVAETEQGSRAEREVAEVAAKPDEQIAGAMKKGVYPQEERVAPVEGKPIVEVDDDRKNVTLGSKSLLIIEDDNNFSRILRDFARERDFLCIIAEDGETGLHFADYYRPSAIILDIGLPGIDGWNVMERLKDNPELRHIPVHFMSAADSSMDALRMGAIGYLTKPVSMEKIDETFGKLENMISKPMSRLLLVEDDTLQRESIKELISGSDVITTAVASGAEAYRELTEGNYDCMILDLGLEDMSGFELLEKIRNNESMSGVPIIIYTGRELSEDEENKLSRYAESIIIKGVKSPERLLDESALFLHRVEANLPEDKRKMLKMVHDKEAVLSGSKILLVDDDMRNVFALTSVLEERGIDIVIARDGIECLEKLKEVEEIDAVLMDIMMPRMDGYEAMMEIRKMAKFQKLPIIALTAKAMKGDRSKCIEAGANDYLAKPVDPDKLLSMLRVWLY